MSIMLYPVQPGELICEDYTVKLNGQEVVLDAARVSAIPYNRRWPGHQREIEQSEVVSFLSFAMDEPVTLEIFPKKPCNGVKIRPESAAIRHEITAEGSILVHLDKPRYFTVEPYGRNHALHVFADDIPGLQKFKQSTDMPLATGEHEYTKWGARDLIIHNAADIVQLDGTGNADEPDAFRKMVADYFRLYYRK